MENEKNTSAGAVAEIASQGAGSDNPISPIEMPDSTGAWIKRVAYGALVGVGAVLPGVSGGAFCAAFGIYRPMMDFFAHPTRNFKKNVRFFLPFIIGCALGFVLLSGLVGKLIAIAGAIVVAFFVGCIAGTMPALYKEANGSAWKAYHWITLAASTALTTWGLNSMSKVESMQRLLDDPHSLTYVITWIVCGVIFAFGSIIPGMSPSSLIMYAELYEPMTVGIGELRMDILLPFVLGVVLCIILFSKLISWLFEKAGSMMFAIIIGVVIASTILVAWSQVICVAVTAAEIIGSITSVIAGFILVVMLAKLDPR